MFIAESVEMAQWVRAFAEQTQRPESKSPAPIQKPGKASHAFNLSAEGWMQVDPGILLVSHLAEM